MNAEILDRIDSALDAAAGVLENFTAGQIEATLKAGDDPVTEADLAVNEVLLGILPRDGEAWLSEETKDDPARMANRRLWVVDPIDGTRVFNHGFTTKSSGHGFGLHTAANAATEMGGSLTADSAGPGKGATFTLELPLRLETTEA